MNDFANPQPPQSSLVASICRHGAGYDHDSGGGYTSSDVEKARADGLKEAAIIKQQFASMTPDAKNFDVERFEQHGRFLVVQALYPNCSKCSYEGRKIMVFENVTVTDLVYWREIDPHFRPGDKALNKKTAPSPVVRFPADPEGLGWRRAIAFASGTVVVK